METGAAPPRRSRRPTPASEVTWRSSNVRRSRDVPFALRLLEQDRFLRIGRNLSPRTTGRTGRCGGWPVVISGADHRPADAPSCHPMAIPSSSAMSQMPSTEVLNVDCDLLHRHHVGQQGGHEIPAELPPRLEHLGDHGVGGSRRGRPKTTPPACSWSGCRDLNPGPPDPQSGALTKLRHSPWWFRRDGNGSVPADRQTTAPDLGPPAVPRPRSRPVASEDGPPARPATPG